MWHCLDLELMCRCLGRNLIVVGLSGMIRCLKGMSVFSHAPIGKMSKFCSVTAGVICSNNNTTKVVILNRPGLQIVQYRDNINMYNSYKYIQIYSASLTGLDEENIPVSDSLGSVFDDDGKRVTGFGSAADTPSFNSATNFYTANAFTGAVTVAGTTEAIVRWGTVKHFTTNLSSGYLPAGPDLNTNRSGTQYLTFAFRRATVANFDINITSSGIRGLWIAAPGTGIDNASGLNGWIDSSINYGGSGVPGSDTGNGGNGSNGCALTGGDIIQAGTSLSGGYTMTLGSENMSNATSNVVLVRIALASGESISALSIGVAS